MSINCGNCDNSHETVDQVRECYGMNASVMTKTVEGQLSWTSRRFPGEYKVTIESVSMQRNQSGSYRLEFVSRFVELEVESPIFTNVTLSGRTMLRGGLLDTLYCKFAGSRLSSVLAEDELTVQNVFTAFKQYEGAEMIAWVKLSDKNGNGNRWCVSSPSTWHVAR